MDGWGLELLEWVQGRMEASGGRGLGVVVQGSVFLQELDLMGPIHSHCLRRGKNRAYNGDRGRAPGKIHSISNICKYYDSNR